MMNNNYTALTNDEVVWHINVTFNCINTDVNFINMILLNSNY
jgi:hypothetical protein